MIVSLALAGAVVTGPAEAIVIRDDVGDAAALSAAGGDDAVGKLLNRNRIDCSATLISPRWVLTAAHCVTDIRYPRLAFGDQRVAAAKWFVHSKWNDNERQGFDIALVKLARPITSITPATVYRGRDEAGQSVRLVGFGDHGDGLTGAVNFDAQRRAGTNVIDRVERVRGGSPHVLVTDFDAPDGGDPTLTLLEATTASGDSGGPLFIGNAVAGITSWGSNDFSEYGDVARYTRVSSFTAWIERILGGRRRAQSVLGLPGDRLLERRAVWRDRAWSSATTFTGSAAAVPEPGTAAAMGLLLWTCLGRRGRGRGVTPGARRAGRKT